MISPDVQDEQPTLPQRALPCYTAPYEQGSALLMAMNHHNPAPGGTQGADAAPESDRMPHFPNRRTLVAGGLIFLIVLAATVTVILTRRTASTAPNPIMATEQIAVANSASFGSISINGSTPQPYDAGLDTPFFLNRATNIITWSTPNFRPITCTVHIPRQANDGCHKGDNRYYPYNGHYSVVFQPGPNDLLTAARAQFGIAIPAGARVASWQADQQRYVTSTPLRAATTAHLRVSAGGPDDLCGAAYVCPVNGSITPDHDSWFLDADFSVQPGLENAAIPFGTPNITGTAMMNVIQANGGWQLAYPNGTQLTQRFWQAESCAPLDDEVDRLVGFSATIPDIWSNTAPGDCTAKVKGGTFIARFDVFYAGGAVAHALDAALPVL